MNCIGRRGHETCMTRRSHNHGVSDACGVDFRACLSMAPSADTQTCKWEHDAYPQAEAHTYIRACQRTQHARAHAYTQAQTHGARARVRTQAHARVRACTRSRTQTHMRACTNACTQTQRAARAPRTHTCTPAGMSTHAHVHARTHAPAPCAHTLARHTCLLILPVSGFGFLADKVLTIVYRGVDGRSRSGPYLPEVNGDSKRNPLSQATGVAAGGLGYRRAADLAAPAFVASRVEARPFVERIATAMESGGVHVPGMMQRYDDETDRAFHTFLSRLSPSRAADAERAKAAAAEAATHMMQAMAMGSGDGWGGADVGDGARRISSGGRARRRG